jgi:hypothetical protein
MRGSIAWLGLTIMTALIGIALVGCASAPSAAPTAGTSQTDLLQAAGFRNYTAKTAKHVAYLNTLPAKKVVSNNYKGQVLYLVCTSPGSKQCYLGDKSAYDRYQKLAIQNSLSEDQRKVIEDRWDPEATEMWVDSQGGG